MNWLIYFHWICGPNCENFVANSDYKVVQRLKYENSLSIVVVDVEWLSNVH